jgi:Tfp pilus assembly protein PilO
MNAKNMFGAITVGIALFFLWPAVFGSWSEMRALKDALAERTQLEKDRAVILDQFTTEYAKLKKMNATEAGKMFAAMVPIGKNGAEVISAMEEIATASGIQLTSVAVSEDPETGSKAADKSYRSMSLKIEMSGSYPALRAFLRGLEQYVRVLNITKLEIITSSGDASAGQLKFTVTADTYFIK